MADRRVNNNELYRLILQQVDESATPRWQKLQVARFFNQAYSDWLRETYRLRAEKDEQAKQDLLPLELTRSLPITTKGINLEGFDPSVYRFLSVDGQWRRSVRRGNGTSRIRQEFWPIKPTTADKLGVSINDPFNCPIDSAAKYLLERHESDPAKLKTLTIYSTTLPAIVTFRYIQEPKLIDFIANPTEYTEVSYDIQQELIRRTAVKMLAKDENYPAAQVELQDVQLNS